MAIDGICPSLPFPTPSKVVLNTAEFGSQVAVSAFATRDQKDLVELPIATVDRDGKNVVHHIVKQASGLGETIASKSKEVHVERPALCQREMRTRVCRSVEKP